MARGPKGYLLGERKQFGNTDTFFTGVFKGNRWKTAEYMGRLQEEISANKLLVRFYGSEDAIVETILNEETKNLGIKILVEDDPILIVKQVLEKFGGETCLKFL